MLMFSVSPVLFGIVGYVGLLLVMLLAALALAPRPLQAPHDPDREYAKLAFRLRHPWKARASRWLWVD